MIEESDRTNENGDTERIVTCSTKSKEMNYVTQWVVDTENRQMKLLTGEKARSMGNVQKITKTTLEEHRAEVKEYLRKIVDEENDEDYADEDDYESDDEDADEETNGEEIDEECDEDDKRKQV